MDRTDTPTQAGRRLPFSLERLRLRFRDPALEAAFRDNRFRHNVANIRFAFFAGIVVWVAWGFLLRPHILAEADRRLDTIMRFGVFIPMLLVGFVLTFTPFFRRIWQGLSVFIATTTILLWVYYVSHILTLPAEYGYVGVILITAFTYTLLRLRFLWVVVITVVGIAAYLPYAFTARYIVDVSRTLATLYLVSFGFLGGLAAYRLERFSRQVFLRERQLDQERERSDALLLNILPQAIVEQLKTSSGGRIAQAFDQVTVVIADAVGSTEQGARSSPERFAAALDELFRRFDDLADRHGLEKIKTIGDAYMAVAGAPVPMANHAAAAVSMALEMLAEAGQVQWPSGDAIRVRIGVATGPAVAGIIGFRKFAYDLWGDTVNLASRLQESAEPGQALVSEPTAELLSHDYDFGPPHIVDLKGKGPTPARVVLGRRADLPIKVPSA
ncbi:MAG TPA: adenylate/guanylate cyclase domain-containing protein [Actinomycetota bacterium]|nr:adenylate/guanylate cyclase domain-containing protein [Actinomycetota bacterium]